MRHPCTPLVAAMLFACQGQGDLSVLHTGNDPDGTGPGTGKKFQKFSCDPAQVPFDLPLRRLTRAQYGNAVRDWVDATTLAPSDKSATLAAVEALVARYPDDMRVGAPGQKHGGYTQLDQTVQQAHVDASYEVAVALGRELTSSPARRTALLGACATDGDAGNDDSCLRAFVASFGQRVLRRPLTGTDQTLYRDAAGAAPVDPAAVADVIALLLTAPEALYHVEIPREETQGPALLDAYSLASRLSFHFWQAPPDAQLLAAASSGALLTPEGYAAEVERLFADPRTNVAVHDFFSQWLRLDELQPMDTRVGTPVFDAFAGEHMPDSDLHRHMQDEIRDLVTWVARTGGTVGDVLTSRKSFARTDDLAALYGQPVWDGTSPPQDFEEPARFGLLTRAAMLASPSGNTRPIMKGFHVRTALLCESVPAPPDNAMAMPIELSPDATTREVVEQITEQTGSSCSGCHSTLLNPLGFVTENFDALGRFRTHQRLFDADGTHRGERPVDTRTQFRFGDRTRAVSGAEDVTRLIAQSGEFESCFAVQYFRFAFGRMEDSLKDGCALATLEGQAQEGRPLAEVLKAVALQPAFHRRDFR